MYVYPIIFAITDGDNVRLKKLPKQDAENEESNIPEKWEEELRKKLIRVQARYKKGLSIK